MTDLLSSLKGKAVIKREKKNVLLLQTGKENKLNEIILLTALLTNLIGLSC